MVINEGKGWEAREKVGLRISYVCLCDRMRLIMVSLIWLLFLDEWIRDNEECLYLK